MYKRQVQPASLIEDVEFGDRVYAEGTLTDVDGEAVPEYPCGIVVYRDGDGRAQTIEVEPDVARILVAGDGIGSLPIEVRAALVDLGILVAGDKALSL